MDEEDHEPQTAIAHLERMVSVFETTMTPGSYTLPRMPDAELRIARLYRDALHDPAAAERSYERTIDRYETSRVRDDAMLELAELLFARHAASEACARLTALLEQYEVGRARRRAAVLAHDRCAAR